MSPEVSPLSSVTPPKVGNPMSAEVLPKPDHGGASLQAYLRIASPLFGGAALASGLLRGSTWAVILGAGLGAAVGVLWNRETHARTRASSPSDLR